MSARAAASKVEEFAQELAQSMNRYEVEEFRWYLGRLGNAALSEAEIEIDQENKTFEEQITSFAAGDSLPVEGHLKIMAKLWERFGFTQPTLTDSQIENLKGAIGEETSDLRVLPTPLLTMDQRKSIMEKFLTSYRDQEIPFTNAGALGPHSNIFGYQNTHFDLTLDPYGGNLGHLSFRDGSQSKHTYSMGYKYVDGSVIFDRGEWARKMVDSDHAIQSDDGTVWVFPVAEVGSILGGEKQDTTPIMRCGHPAQVLKDEVNPAFVFETEMTISLAKLFEGRTAISNGTINGPVIVNEALYRVGPDAEAEGYEDDCSVMCLYLRPEPYLSAELEPRMRGDKVWFDTRPAINALQPNASST